MTSVGSSPVRRTAPARASNEPRMSSGATTTNTWTAGERGSTVEGPRGAVAASRRRSRRRPRPKPHRRAPRTAGASSSSTTRGRARRAAARPSEARTTSISRDSCATRAAKRPSTRCLFARARSVSPDRATTTGTRASFSSTIFRNIDIAHLHERRRRAVVSVLTTALNDAVAFGDQALARIALEALGGLADGEGRR